MSRPSLVDEMKERFGEAVTDCDLECVDPWIGVAPEGLVEICEFLKSDEDLRFNLLNCITGVDYFHTDPKKAAKASWEPHTEVIYHLSSTLKAHSIVLRVTLPRWKDDVEGQLPEVPSVAGVWRTADWHEREVYDLNGIWFTGHPDMRRILCPEDWEGFPLRKDYEMPLEYHGMRGR